MAKVTASRMDIRLHNLLYRYHRHRCVLLKSHDCRLISRKIAILHTRQSKRSGFNDFGKPAAPVATVPTKALTTSQSTSHRAGSTTKKRVAGVSPKSQASPSTTAKSFPKITDGEDLRNQRREKECHDVRKDFGYADGLDNSRSKRDEELDHFLKRINRSCKTGNYDEGLYFLKRMVSAGHIPGAVLCTKLIKGFSCSPNHTATCAISKAQEVMEILENHGSPDEFAYNALLTVICKESKASSAKHVIESGTAFLDRMRAQGCSPNIVTYNILINALCSKGRLDLAMKVLDPLQQENKCQPTVVTYTILIEASIMNTYDDNENGEGKGGGIRQAIKLLEEMAAKGLQPDSYTYSAILTGMCTHGLVDQAWQLVRTLSRSPQPGGTWGGRSSFTPIPAPDVISYNILLRSLLGMRRWEDAEKLVSEMVSTGHCRPNVVTYSILVNSLCQQGMVDKAIKVLYDMLARGFKPDSYCCNPIISTYFKQGRIDLAITFMERILSCGYTLDIVGYNTILDSLCKNGTTYQALEVLDKLEEMGCPPNTGSYNAVIGGLWNNGDRNKAMKILSQMVDKGINPDEFTYNVLISCLCRDGMVDHALQLMADMEDTWGYLPTVITYNTIILGLCKVHSIDAAIDILEKMMERGCRPNESTYTTLVKGLAYAGHKEEAAEVSTALLSSNAISRDSIRQLKKTFPGLQNSNTLH